MRKILTARGEIIPPNMFMPTGTAIPLENKFGNPSIIYFPQVNFQQAFKTLYTNGYPSSDFEIVQRTEVMNHETEHARHFKHGFLGITLERFDFTNRHENILFTFISEVIAHKSHILALGLTNPLSNYPRDYQQGLLSELQRYMKLSMDIFKSKKVNPELLEEVQKNLAGQFRFNAL